MVRCGRLECFCPLVVILALSGKQFAHEGIRLLNHRVRDVLSGGAIWRTAGQRRIAKGQEGQVSHYTTSTSAGTTLEAMTARLARARR